MNRYIVNSEAGKQMIYAKPYEGICTICEKPGGWGKEKNICNEAGEKFCLSVDGRNYIHMVAVSKDNRLIYIKGKNGRWQSTVIAQNIPQIGKIEISVSEQRKDMFYSALHDDEWILVHCVLGNGARPHKIAVLCDENFCVFENRVYFSDTDENLCYMDFSDGKPVNSIKLYKGRMPYVTKMGTNTYVAYNTDTGIFVNEERYVNDTKAETPIIVKRDDGFVLMWRAGDFIRYADGKNKKIRHIAAGVQPDMLIYTTPSGKESFYGNFNNNILKVYPNINISEPKNIITENKEEIQRLKNLLEEQNAVIRKYKEEIAKLNDIIFTMSKNSYEDRG